MSDQLFTDGSAGTGDLFTDGSAGTGDLFTDGSAGTGDLFTDGFAERVVIDGHLCKDLHWLAGAVESFARYGELEAVVELARFAGPHLSADGLAEVAGQLALALRKAAEAAL